MYKRNCPGCNAETVYKNEQSYHKAVTKNNYCISCAKSGNKMSQKHQPHLWIRDCDSCGQTKIFKSYVTWFRSMKSTSVWKCNSCSHMGLVGHKHTEEHKNYMRAKMKNRKITWGNLISKSHWSKNEKLRDVIIQNHSNHMAQLISNGKITLGNNRGFKHGKYVSKFGEVEHYRSSYELKRMQELDADSSVIHWTTKHKIIIPYTVNGKSKRYIPDFKIQYNDDSVLIEEVKGYINDIIMHEAKVAAATDWASANGFTYNVNFMRKEVT